MVINGNALRREFPVQPYISRKKRFAGVSYGQSEAGYDLRIRQNVVLHPFKRFVLASTEEVFDMPNDLVAIVHDKSTWARSGLSVFNTVVEPGFKGGLTLELVYHGWGILRIPAGAGIAQAIFHKLAEPARYNGKYQNQTIEPQKAIFK